MKKIWLAIKAFLQGYPESTPSATRKYENFINTSLDDKPAPKGQLWFTVVSTDRRLFSRGCTYKHSLSVSIGKLTNEKIEGIFNDLKAQINQTIVDNYKESK